MGKEDVKPQVTMPKWVNFAFGGISGMMAVTVVHPADLLKTRMQIASQSEKDKSVVWFARGIAKNEGIRGFYSGLSAALLRQATYTTARLGSFNVIMDSFHTTYGGAPSFLSKLGIGMVSGALGAYVGTPADVALIRMTADAKLPVEKRRNYKNVFNALSRMVREEGVTTLWRGATTTCTRAMIVNAAQLGTYAQAREMLLSTLDEGILLHFVASMISGFITSVASLPMDNVKTRVQYARKNAGQSAVLMGVIRNEGILTLWSGLLPTYAKLGPMTVLIFVFLEQMNAFYYKYATPDD